MMWYWSIPDIILRESLGFQHNCSRSLAGPSTAVIMQLSGKHHCLYRICLHTETPALHSRTTNHCRLSNGGSSNTIRKHAGQHMHLSFLRLSVLHMSILRLSLLRSWQTASRARAAAPHLQLSPPPTSCFP
jgi:hypothetical protein